MSLPNSEDYQRLIQNPQNCFHDPVLKGGRPLNRPNQPIPRAFTGNFADVYQIISGSDKWAVKCFTREAKDICQRYSAIGDFLQKSKLSCMVEFDYLDRGMRVSGTAWVHVLKMRWVEGDSLNEFLFKYLDKPNILNTLAEKWLSLARDLTKAGMAHGDLQHGNVLLVPHANGGVSLKLIDYDGMFVPALAGHKANELGHPNFQHPLRGDDPFHADIDRFSHLVIFTAIRSLAATGDRTLWSRYENADNLLFTATDFKEPGESPVFKELWKLPDPDVHALVGHLILAALAPPRQTPLLPDLFDAAGVLPLTPQQVKEVEEQFKVKWKSLRSSSPASPSTAPVIVSPAATFTPLLPWMLQPAVRTPTPAPATAATATPAFPWTAVVASSPLTASAAPAIPRQLWVRQVGILVGRAYRGAKPLIDRIRQSTRPSPSN